MPKFETLFSKYDRLVLFDTETTGLDSNVEALTEIGAVYVENGKINLSGSGEELLQSDAVRKAYLGG